MPLDGPFGVGTSSVEFPFEDAERAFNLEGMADVGAGVGLGTTALLFVGRDNGTSCSESELLPHRSMRVGAGPWVWRDRGGFFDERSGVGEVGSFLTWPEI